MGYLQKVFIFVLAILIYPTLSFSQNTTKNTDASIDAINMAAQAASPDASKVYFDEQMALALKGDTSGMVGVGMGYQSGDGAEQDTAKMLYWYEKAATLNDTEAMRNLAYQYLSGELIPKDDKMAFNWEEKCAKLSDVYCMETIAYYYHSGTIVDKNLSEAEKWYLKASKEKGPLRFYAHGMRDPQISAAEALEDEFGYTCKVRGRELKRYFACKKHK